MDEWIGDDSSLNNKIKMWNKKNIAKKKLHSHRQLQIAKQISIFEVLEADRCQSKCTHALSKSLVALTFDGNIANDSCVQLN